MPQFISRNGSTARSGSQAGSGSTNQITPELVMKVADRVYEMLLEEMRIEFERRRPYFGAGRHMKGGR